MGGSTGSKSEEGRVSGERLCTFRPRGRSGALDPKLVKADLLLLQGITEQLGHGFLLILQVLPLCTKLFQPVDKLFDGGSRRSRRWGRDRRRSITGHGSWRSRDGGW